MTTRNGRNSWCRALLTALMPSALGGCASLQGQYVQKAHEEFARQPVGPEQLLQPADIAHLPAVVQRYLVTVGAVGRPKVQNFRVEFEAGMVRKPGQAPLPSTSEQYNFFGQPTRLFYMKSRMLGLPVRVLHVYREEHATMVVRAASLFKVVDLAGPQLDQAETVTVLNDWVVFAPAALIDPRLSFREVDDQTVEVTFQNGPHRVQAMLHFNEAGELTNFVSDDRSALQPDGSLKRYRWSTPLSDYREFEGRKVPTRGQAIYRYPEGDFTYGRFVLTGIAYNVKSFREL